LRTARNLVFDLAQTDVEPLHARFDHAYALLARLVSFPMRPGRGCRPAPSAIGKRLDRELVGAPCSRNDELMNVS
jgi:hypothetical protein